MKLEVRTEVLGVMLRPYLIVTLPSGKESKVSITREDYASLQDIT